MWTYIPIPCTLCYIPDSMLLLVTNVVKLLLFQTPEDASHKVRVAVGNGLRLDIWEPFQERFKVPKICEFFGATEGTSAFMNVSNRVGACGRMSPFIVRYPIFI